MKNILPILFSLCSLLTTSQVPQSLNYQAVARNSNSNVILNQFISVEISIRDGSPTAPIVYQEVDTVTTNQFGLFTVAIGTGQLQSGNFTTINWATGNKYLQVGFDETGGNSFTDMGTTELLSVPYALYAANSGNITDYAVYSEMEPSGTAPETILIDSAWQARQLNATEDSAGTSITRSGNYITLQPGTYHISASAQWGLSVAGAGEYNGGIDVSSVLRLANNSNNIFLSSQAEHYYILYLWASGQFLIDNNNPTESYAISIEGVITVLSTTTFALQHYISWPNTYGTELLVSTNAGIPTNLGPEIYSRIFIQKIN